MCFDPVTALAIGSTAIGAAGQLSQASAAQSAANMQAKIYESQAKTRAAQASFDESRVRDQVGAILGGQTAYYASSGLDVTQGSPVTIAAQTAAQGEVDAVLTRQKGQADAAGLNLQAEQERQAGKQAMMQGVFGAGTTLLSGFGSVARWSSLQPSSAGMTSGTTIDLSRYARLGQSVGSGTSVYGYGGLY